jgi:hypothetical protein
MVLSTTIRNLKSIAPFSTLALVLLVGSKRKRTIRNSNPVMRAGIS